MTVIIQSASGEDSNDDKPCSGGASGSSSREPTNDQRDHCVVARWSLDLFDLFILLYVAPVLGTLFFPSSNAALSLAAVQAAFALTLLLRPVGSARSTDDVRCGGEQPRRYFFGAVVDGVVGVVAGALVVAGAGGAIVALRFQSTATTITTTITAAIAYQKRLSPKKFIATSLTQRSARRRRGCSGAQ